MFDLEVWKDGAPGRHPRCGPPGPDRRGQPAHRCRLLDAINDGDSNGPRTYTDALANAALAWGIHNQALPYSGALAKLDDPATNTVPGPNFDYGWFPTALNRGGIQIGTANTPPVVAETTPPSIGGKLIGFGAGYKTYLYPTYLPGVGMRDFDPEFGSPYGYFGFGSAAAPQNVVFEGQLSVAA